MLIGCLIKVFVQIEFGRFAIAEGRTTMQGINMVPGPRLRVSWLLWYWLIMFSLGVGQLGGIVGGVGQSLALAYPLTGDFVRELKREANDEHAPTHSPSNEPQAAVADAQDAAPRVTYTKDDVIWATIVAVVTSVLLVIGRYGLVQNVSTVLVVTFTLVTIFNVLALPYFSDARMTLADLGHGLSFRLPPGSGSGRCRRWPRCWPRSASSAWCERASSPIPTGAWKRDTHDSRGRSMRRPNGPGGARLAARDALGRLVLDGHLHLRDDGLLRAGRRGLAS